MTKSKEIAIFKKKEYIRKDDLCRKMSQINHEKKIISKNLHYLQIMRIQSRYYQSADLCS